MNKKNSLILLSIVFLLFNCSFHRSFTPTETVTSTTVETAAAKTSTDICLSPEEKELYNLMMAYRREKGLGQIPVSASLTKVAQLHVKDLQQNQPSGRCNMHSWSKAYGDCCYTDDHRNAKCMWSKPRELTSYTGNGYEISFWSSDNAKANDALRSWQGSSGHNSVIINKSIWKDNNWQAIGIGIYGEYAVVWFGEEVDPAGAAGNCIE